MVGSVNDSSFDINEREAGDNTVFHRFFDTGLNRSDVFTRNDTADDFVFKLRSLYLAQAVRTQPKRDRIDHDHRIDERICLQL